MEVEALRLVVSSTQQGCQAARFIQVFWSAIFCVHYILYQTTVSIITSRYNVKQRRKIKFSSWGALFGRRVFSPKVPLEAWPKMSLFYWTIHWQEKWDCSWTCRARHSIWVGVSIIWNIQPYREKGGYLNKTEVLIWRSKGRNRGKQQCSLSCILTH